MTFDGVNKLVWIGAGIGGERPDRGKAPTCLYDRDEDVWIKLDIAGIEHFGGTIGNTVYDPEHNVFLGLRGGAFRLEAVPQGTRAASSKQ
jgi:hypothetical protein